MRNVSASRVGPQKMHAPRLIRHTVSKSFRSCSLGCRIVATKAIDPASAMARAAITTFSAASESSPLSASRRR